MKITNFFKRLFKSKEQKAKELMVLLSEDQEILDLTGVLIHCDKEGLREEHKEVQKKIWARMDEIKKQYKS